MNLVSKQESTKEKVCEVIKKKHTHCSLNIVSKLFFS